MASPAATFAQRAKEWQTTPFIAEWIDNTFIQCTGEGKLAFENWVMTKWGAEKGSEMIKECNKRVPQGKWIASHDSKNVSPADKTKFMWQASAAFYGVTLIAMQNWHQYAGGMNLFHPERTKPPPKRRKGESSGQWMSRVNELLLDGHKLPNVDLDIARRIAISEFDKTRDTLELWRTDSKLFFSDILARTKSIIPSPHVLSMDGPTAQRTNINDAFRTRLTFLNVVYLAWKDAAELFEYLAEKGLHTASAVERAYQKDSSLVWRFMSVINRTNYMARKMWANFSQLVAASDHYRPLLKTWRDETGLARIEPNVTAIQRRIRQKTYSSLDDIVVQFMIEIAPQPKGFFQGVEMGLSEDPSQAKNFSAAVFDAMGDVAATNEFVSQFADTPFGNRLTEYAAALESTATDVKGMRSIIYFMDPQKLSRAKVEYWDKAGEVNRSIREMQEAWSTKVWELSVDPLLQWVEDTQGPNGLHESMVIPLPLFNNMWAGVDTYLWARAKSLERPGEQGRVAREFGLFDPADPKRPMASEYLLRSLDPEMGVPVKAQTTPAPYVQNIPVAGPGDSIVKSGYAYVSSLLGGSGSKEKEKVKTRGTVVAEEEEEMDGDTEEAAPTLPEVLPTEFKIGKKVLKLFHRVLEPPEEEKENAPAKGQVRWGDFENAMKRIGFEVVQTAGSSVRFDPPAATARPITFHRPHPDSLLTPHAIKWVGARLKRTYGWTADTFSRGAGDEAA
ncbi:hypothetical protein C8R43DRAFT_318962 [Mycena crocata]|nr:hypothetical protein C8R43DRAFT_318962 [Mycena crocata]